LCQISSLIIIVIVPQPAVGIDPDAGVPHYSRFVKEAGELVPSLSEHTMLVL
jgi:hypothetical protein